MKRTWPESIKELTELQAEYLQRYKFGWVMRHRQREADHYYTYEIRRGELSLPQKGTNLPRPRSILIAWLNRIRKDIIDDANVHPLLKVNLLLNIAIMKGKP